MECLRRMPFPLNITQDNKIIMMTLMKHISTVFSRLQTNRFYRTWPVKLRVLGMIAMMVPCAAYAGSSPSLAISLPQDFGMSLPLPAMSGDGSVVVSENWVSDVNNQPQGHIFRWSKATGMVDLGMLDERDSTASVISVSGDGSVIVGESGTKDGEKHFFRWTEAEGIKDLGTLGGKRAFVRDLYDRIPDAFFISSDGSVIVGENKVKGGESHIFRWTQKDGMKDLGMGTPGAGGLERTSVKGVSSDGNVIVWENKWDRQFIHAFRWTETEGTKDLTMDLRKDPLKISDDFHDGYVSIGAVSSDGSGVVVERSMNKDTFVEHAFRWTQATGMEDIGTLGGENTSMVHGLFGENSNARFISSDGSVIVGVSHGKDEKYHIFRWTQKDGMKDLGTLKEGMTDEDSFPTGISSDGSVIVIKKFAADKSKTHLFRWTKASEMKDLGAADMNEGPSLVSSDGKVIVDDRTIDGFGHHRVFRWAEAEGIKDLGTLGEDSFATAMSNDGSVIIGICRVRQGLNEYHTFRWTQETGMEDIGALASQAKPMSGKHYKGTK